MAVSQKKSQCFFSFIIFFLFFSLLFTSSIHAQDEETLLIEVYDSNDWNQSVGTTVFEGRSYDVTVSTDNTSIILGVNITFLGTTYNTSTEQPFVTFTAPSFDDTETFLISAAKNGYLPSEIEVEVMKGTLSFASLPTTVEGKKQFQVTVTDQDHLPVENAFVYVTSESVPVPTDVRGVATLVAPDVSLDSSFTLEVLKTGYQPDSATIRVQPAQGVFFSLSESDLLQLLPLLVAVLVVIFSIVIVSWRKKHRSPDLEPHMRIRHQHQPPDDYPEKPKRQAPTESAMFSVNGKKSIPVASSDSRVEEIRIPVQEKKKETTIITDEKPPSRPSTNHKNQDDDWFKGQEYMRYKIDELTGKIDTSTDGKWFEGERDIRDKVDEALKKNVKKKKEEDIIK